MMKPNYTLTERIVSLVGQIAEATGRFSASTDQSLRLRRTNRIRTVHGSVAIEGNTLSEEQITAILAGKRVAAPPREILEVQNALKAYDQMSKWEPENESDLLSAHAVLMSGLLEDAGKYRRLDLSHRPTFRKNYLRPAMDLGLIAMSQPDSPRSPTQEYFLTAKGKEML